MPGQTGPRHFLLQQQKVGVIPPVMQLHTAIRLQVRVTYSTRRQDKLGVKQEINIQTNMLIRLAPEY